MVWNVGKRRPHCHKDSIHAQGSVVGIDSIPEETDKQSHKYDEEREEESKRRTALYGVWEVQSGTDDTVGSDQKRCNEVAESNDTHNGSPG